MSIWFTHVSRNLSRTTRMSTKGPADCAKRLQETTRIIILASWLRITRTSIPMLKMIRQPAKQSLRKVIFCNICHGKHGFETPKRLDFDPKIKQKVNWKHARTKKRIFTPRCPTSSQNHPQITKNRILDPMCLLRCSPALPGCSGGAKVVPQGDKMESPSLPNDSFGQSSWAKRGRRQRL